MRKDALAQCELKRLSQSPAMTFLQSCGEKIEDSSYFGADFYALLDGDEAIAILIVGNPKTKELRRNHTTEIFKAAVGEGVDRAAATVALVERYLDAASPWSVFTEAELSGASIAALELLGFSTDAIEGDRQTSDFSIK